MDTINFTKDFFLPTGSKFFLPLDNKIEKLKHPFTETAKVFRHNLNSIVDTLSVPFAFGFSATHDNHFQRLHIAERIRAHAIDSSSSELTRDEERKAYERATEKMQSFLVSKEGMKHITHDVSKFLSEISKESGVKIGISELHRQGVVLLWGTFEMFARDLFVLLLNSRPKMVRKLLDSPKTKRLFNVKAIPFEELEEHGFNFSENMGTYLLSLHDLNDLTAIKDVYKTLFGQERKLREYFSNNELWLLYQKRNLIVHRRSIIDKQYLQNTGETAKLGTELVVTANSLEESLGLIKDLGGELINAVM